jgi:predicted nucleotidyltransferase
MVRPYRIITTFLQGEGNEELSALDRPKVLTIMNFMPDIDMQFVIDTILRDFPDTEAVYLFGSTVDSSLHDASDIDIAVLLPPQTAAAAGNLSFTDLRVGLEDHYHRDLDLINIREVSAVFRMEIIMKGERIFTVNRVEAEIFEMLSLSFYQKLNEERKELIEELYRTGRAYNV